MPDFHTNLRSQDRKRLVLVVEDEIVNREMLRAVLEDEYEVAFAANGREAMEQLRASAVSLVLLDLNLPDIHGLDILREIKASEPVANIPVIVMTSDKEAEVESLTLGAVDFIPKPYPQPKVILARVLRTIELYEDRDIILSTERDQLTGLYNREFFYRYAEEYDLYHRDGQMDAIVLDINRFHMINERYGKAYCDALLRRIGEKVKVLAQEAGGIACRREADTFLMYRCHRDDYAHVLEVASSAVEEDARNRIRLRMGVDSCVDKTIDMERRFDHAALAVDSIRSNYAKSIALYDSTLHQAELFDEQLLEAFDDAIEQKQFLVYYQPKFNVRGQEPVLCSAEALVRWDHPELGMISPGSFIPLFEDNGLVQRLDSYVWRETAAQISDWKKRLGVSVPVSVNVSRVDMFDNDLVPSLQKLLSEHGLTPEDLELEITESAYTQDSAQIVAVVQRMRGAGFRIEMDDFGSGYSSLNMLSTLPIDALKLDMQFIRNAFRGRKDTRMLEAVIGIAESLQVPTIAEGAETAEQMLALKSMGCDVVQGYYFSRPVPAAAFEQFLLARRELEENGGLPGEEEKKAGVNPRATGDDAFTYDALHDPITGLYNHSAFNLLFRDADPAHIALLLFDILGFGDTVKASGQYTADRLAKRLTDQLKTNFRSVDSLCRISGSEFAVIMTRADRELRSQVKHKLESIREGMRAGGGGVPGVSLSIGVAFPETERTRDDLFQDADDALAKARALEGGGFVIHE